MSTLAKSLNATAISLLENVLYPLAVIIGGIVFLVWCACCLVHAIKAVIKYFKEGAFDEHS